MSHKRTSFRQDLNPEESEAIKSASKAALGAGKNAKNEMIKGALNGLIKRHKKGVLFFIILLLLFFLSALFGAYSFFTLFF